MRIIVNKSKLTFAFFITLGLFVSVVGVFVLPERFFFDTKIILYDKYKELGWRGSYPFTILFYKITGLKELHFSLIGIIQYSIVAFLTYKIGVPKNFDKLRVKNILTYLSFIMIAVFLCMPTKEFINYLCITFIALLLKKSNDNLLKNIIFVLLSLIVFGSFFREYYMLVAFLSVIFYLVSKVNIKKKKLATIFYGLLTAVFVSLSYGVIKGEFISQKTRESYNALRMNGEASNSMIISPLNTESWYGESFGIVYGFFSVNLPLNGLKHYLSPQIIAFVLWQSLLFIILLIRYEKSFKKGLKNNYELWVYYILFSFFIVQGIFEPDLGSAIRHKMGFFPIIYLALYYQDFSLDSKKKKVE
ncbi:hypothetical protein DS884_07660 [Tenacibaculum sp. E3R01]|uniref:hypothetical protein n=1 Tax=Tenacibaculum sp. E3R01 TaxID=2267227 RepID=UPI000DEA04E4|nr:hypothetical protein [Tenacibaculum sp. E3R01]RBW59602.1 hypothetical protein DS884_07660 [Tenacibaculum sp. E3R01]